MTKEGDKHLTECQPELAQPTRLELKTEQANPIAMIDLDDDAIMPLYLPTSVVIRIFSYLSRDELDLCLLVCKKWKWLVEYGGEELQSRPLDCLELSSKKEFTITIYYGRRTKKFAFKKYFMDRDIRGAEVTTDTRNEVATFREDGIDYKFPCQMPLQETISPTMQFIDFGNFHHEICRQRHPASYSIYKGRAVYGKKLFTPPLEFYERMSWLLKDCEVKRLVLTNFSLTDEFVEKLPCYLPSNPLMVDSLFVHSCRLRSISVPFFHRLITGIIQARNNYHLDNLRFALPDHINGDLLQQPAILRARVFCLQHVLGRYNTALNVNIDLEAFLHYVRALEAYAGERSSRKFFGLSSYKMEAGDAIRDYKEIFNASHNPNAYFPHVLIGTLGFRSPQLEEELLAMAPS